MKRVLCGDARNLSGVDDASVQCIVTSVPYWGLRRYTDDDCEIGREETLQEWLGNLVDCAREWRRVLRDDGTLWVNCGDSYANDAKGPRSNETSTLASPGWQIHAQPPGMQKSWRNCDGIKRKDLIGLPWHLAFALQADGWYLRSAICWSKGLDWTDAEREAQQQILDALAFVRTVAEHSLFGLSGAMDAALKSAENAVDRLMMSGSVMPESVADRPTSAYEMLFLFSKSEQYFYDIDAIRIPQSSNSNPRGNGSTPKGELAEQGLDRANNSFHISTSNLVVPGGRNARNVWRIPTENTPSGGYQLSDGRVINHFASYPKALAARAILAATSEYGACAKCGAPWARVTRPTPDYAELLGKDWADYEQDAEEGRGHSISPQRPTKRGATATASYETVAWEPTCRCYGEPVEAGVVCEKCRGTGHKLVYGQCNCEVEFNRSGRDHSGPLEQNPPTESDDPCPTCLCPDCDGTGLEMKRERGGGQLERQFDATQTTTNTRRRRLQGLCQTKADG